MGRLTNSKRLKLLKITKAKLIISELLLNGLIKEEDIIKLFSQNLDYGFRKNKERLSYKEKILKEIFNSPFVLLDQQNLSARVKYLLPYFLEARYDMEKNTIDYYLEKAYMSEEEYTKEIDELEFCYYRSSNDGKKILIKKNKNGNLLI